MARLPDIDDTLAVLARVGSAPTAPYHEHHVLRAIARELSAVGIEHSTDAYAQLHARVATGGARRSLALVAHTDHPGFEVIEANGHEGRARVLGGFYERAFAREVPVVVYEDDSDRSFRAVLDDFASSADAAHNSVGNCRIRTDRELAVGQWAVPDVPAFERRADELHMRAADDLALCAVAILTLAALRGDARPHDVRAIFTRAEETGLYGARLVAEDDLLPRETIVVSLEASRALPHVRPGAGPVVRPGDMHNTFSNDGERYLRVARERLAEERIVTQRALLTGGTCEASAFVRLGWSATGIALPNVNYHNRSDEGDEFVPEVVRLSDLRAAVALLVEAAVAAGSDEDESWWPDVRRVPRDIRSLLRHED